MIGIAILLLGAVLVLAVIGYVGSARLLRTGTIASLGIGLICLGAYELLYGFASTLLTTRPVRALLLVQSHADVIRLFLRRAFAAGFAFYWGLWSVIVFGLGDNARRGLNAFLKASFQLGSATISVSVILTFVLVLVATFFLAAAIRSSWRARSFRGSCSSAASRSRFRRLSAMPSCSEAWCSPSAPRASASRA